MIDIVVVGSGAVAEGLARAIAGASGGPEVRLVQIWTRNAVRGMELSTAMGVPWSGIPENLAHADLYILAVSDRAVGDVSQRLPFPAEAVVAHTAGCVSIDEISPRITHRAVFYPLQSFTRGRIIEQPRRIPFFVEGATPHALDAVREVAAAISDSVTVMSSTDRAHIHLAGAFANNFTNAMLSLAEDLAGDVGVGFDLLKPLVSETLTKALAMPSPRDAQTGAAQRGDHETQQRHLALLAEKHPDLRELYKDISEQIWRISKRN